MASQFTKFRKIGFQNRIGNIVNTASLLASPTLATNYNLTLPATLPTTGIQALFADSNGILSWNATLNAGVTNAFSGGNNVSTPTTVTGLTMTTTSFATANIFVTISAATNQTAVFNLTTTFNIGTGAYTLTYYSQGDDVGLGFTINPTTAQILYTSPLIAGFTALSMSWVTPKVITNFVPSAVTSLFNAASPQVANAPVAGLVVTASFTSVSIQVTVFATTPLTQVVDLKIYSKAGGGANNYALVQSNDGDDTGILFSVVTASGQVQYTSPSFAGWTATTMQWTNPPTLTTTPTILSNLSITGPFQVVNGGVTLGSQGATLTTSALSATSGSTLTLPAWTVQDTATATAGTLASYQSVYLGAPTLSALNTGVTTTTASTLTIAGAPLAGTNETITSAFALNVTSGISNFNGDIFVRSLTATFVPGTQVNTTSPIAYVWNPTPSTSYTNTLTGFTWSADGRYFTPNSIQPLLISWSVNLGTQAELVFGQNTTDGNTAFNTAGNMLCVSATAYNSEQTVTYVWHPPSATSTIGFFYNPPSNVTVSNSGRNTLKITRYH